jgi:hypothetical protein
VTGELLREGMRFLARLRMDDGRPWDQTAEPYQFDDARALLDPESPVLQHWWERPRGGRKTSDLAGCILALMKTQAPDHARAFIQAADEDQAADVIDAAAGFVKRMSAEDNAEWDVTGRKITCLSNQASALAVAMDASAMGKRPWLVVVDELTNWPDVPKSRKQWDVMTSAVLKVPGCRLVVGTNAGSPGHFTAKLVERFEKSPHWRVSARPVGGNPWLTPEDHQRLQELATTEEAYRRLHLNERISSGGRLTTAEAVRACATLPGTLPPVRGVRYVAGLDVGVVNDRTVLAVAHCEPRDERWDGLDLAERYWTVVVDALFVWQGTRKQPVDLQRVEAEIVAVGQEYGATVVYDPHQAVLLGQRLRSAGIAAEPFTFTVAGNAHLASTMVRLLRERALRIPADDDDLIDELLHVNLRETSQGTLRMDHDAGRHDDRAVAIALAAQHLLGGTKVEAAAQRNQRHIIVQPRWSHLNDRGEVDPKVVGLWQKFAEVGDPTARRVLAGTPTTTIGRRGWRG